MQTDDKSINLLELLDGINFPASREEAVIFAENNGASEDALNLLRAIPEKNYTDIKDFNSELGEMRSPTGAENIFSSAEQDFSEDLEEELLQKQT